MNTLNLNYDTFSYIIGVCKDKIKSNYHPHDQPIVIIFSLAKERLSFQSFQQLADWIFWMGVWFPEGMAERSLALAIAQNSYYWCYRLTDRKWKVFEELADTTPKLIHTVSANKSIIIDQIQPDELIVEPSFPSKIEDPRR